MGREGIAVVAPAQVEKFLRRHVPDAELIKLEPLKGDESGGLKAYGYGAPLMAVYRTQGEEHRVVLRTMAPDPFGHSRRADHAYQMVLSRDTFATIPKHIEALDCGAFDESGAFVSAPSGEWYLISTYVAGELYAGDLNEACSLPAARKIDLDRSEALAGYLAELHSERVDPAKYVRHARDTIGSGEGIFGQVDAYPPDDAVVTPDRLRSLELELVRWRWKLRESKSRAARTHGDFHPFNVLFRDGTDFSVLDCSRGGVGEPADDVTCMSINYLFFALRQHGTFDGPMRELWDVFWRRYLADSKDNELLGLVAPYFAWRALVVISPVWYPGQDNALRETMLRFIERLAGGATFTPDGVDELLA